MKVIKMANGPGDSRHTDPKYLLDQRLADLHAAVRHRQKDWAATLATAPDLQGNLADVVRRERAARAALEQQLAERQAQYEINIARAAAVRAMIDEQIAEAALEVERARHAEASAAALVKRLTLAEADAAARLAEREEQFATELSTITATCDGLEQRLSDAEAALESARHRHALATAEVARLTRRDAELTSQYAAEAATRATLERRVAFVEAALLDSSEQLSSERAHAAERLATYQARIQEEIAARRSVEETFASAQTVYADAEKRHESAISAAAAVLAEREAELTAMVAEAAAIQIALERRVAEAERALSDAQQQHRTAMATAAARLAEREAQFETELASITATRDGLEEQLADVEARLTQETGSRTALEQTVVELRSAAAAAEQRLRGEIEAITESARNEQAALEDQISRERHDHGIRLTNEQEQHRSALAIATTRFAEREAQFTADLVSIAGSRDALERQLLDVDAKLTEEIESRTALEQALTELRATAAAAEQGFRDEIRAATENAAAEHARLEDQLSRERHAHEIRLANEQEQRRSALAVAATQLAEREVQFKTELASIAGSRDSFERQLQDAEARLTQVTESRTTLEQALAELRSTAAAAEQRFRDEIGTITENAAKERGRLEEQMSIQRALADDRLAERRAEFEAELKRLSGDHANAVARLRASIAERDLRLEERARASAALRNQLDASENENRLQFEEAPVPLIRCTRDVAIAGVNRAFGTLVGCRVHGELRDQVVAALFESRDDLIWLIERSMNTRKTELVETTCIRRDGTRIAVRLSARACASGLVEIAAEDLTVVRVLEDRLREARRMESVGRLASEVAVTCEKLLSDVHRDAQRLLTTMTGAEASRSSETLLEEVTRVGSFLHQLVAYAHEQAAALAPVDLTRVLRDLEPVLRQVAGDSVTLELRKTSSPVNVDVNAERVERLLVNVASYGRQRMPNGGRLLIELSTVVVDGKFIAQHPNVRQGLHALITVTEVARPAAPDSASDARLAPGRPGVDLGALQELISECGGHLWITAEPGGSMVVKMRLPLRAAWEHTQRGARHRVGRATARLLGR